MTGSDDKRVTGELESGAAASRSRRRRVAGLAVGAVSAVVMAVSLFSLSTSGVVGASQGVQAGSDAPSVLVETVHEAVEGSSGEPDGSGGVENASSLDAAGNPDASHAEGAGSVSGAVVRGGEAADAHGVDEAAGRDAPVRVSVVVDASAASSLGFPAVMASVSPTLPSGATAYDALASTGLGIGGSGSYVSSIGGLAERALGGTSGWMYSVNGTTPMTPASAYRLSDGDSVRWHYVA